MSRQLGFPTSPRSYADIEEAAALARTALLPVNKPTEALPGVPLFEQLDAYAAGRGAQLDYQVKPLPAGVEALTRYDPSERQIIVTLSEETYSALEHKNPRARLTLAHEVGHIVLHSALLIKLAEIPHRKMVVLMRGSWPKFPVYRDTEWQADAFASALLAPAKGLAILEERGGLSPTVVSKTFEMSRKAAGVRLEVYAKKKRELLAVRPAV